MYLYFLKQTHYASSRNIVRMDRVSPGAAGFGFHGKVSWQGYRENPRKHDGKINGSTLWTVAISLSLSYRLLCHKKVILHKRLTNLLPPKYHTKRAQCRGHAHEPQVAGSDATATGQNRLTWSFGTTSSKPIKSGLTTGFSFLMHSQTPGHRRTITIRTFIQFSTLTFTGVSNLWTYLTLKLNVVQSE